MMYRDPAEPVKVKAKFPRNNVADYEDYLICVTDLNNHKRNAVVIQDLHLQIKREFTFRFHNRL
jgi:hypothetical protein